MTRQPRVTRLHSGYYAVFFADPDGIELELVFEPQLRGRASQ